VDSNGQSLGYVYGHADPRDAAAAILANPVMIGRLPGVPDNGKPFPDGSKMAKIHWNPKKSAEAPDPTTRVPGTLHDVDFMERDSTRGSRTAADGDGPPLTMTPRLTRSHPPP
jgi:hypothetical protein